MGELPGLGTVDPRELYDAMGLARRAASGPRAASGQSCFGLQRVVLVGDRGMLTAARIREDLADVDGLRWITTLRAPTIRKLVAAGTVTRRCSTNGTSPRSPAVVRFMSASSWFILNRSPTHQDAASQHREESK